ncbi:MAG: 6-hydroxymethylpterin diphosphokinase MptE-like protein [Planctomycetota bacterium]
MYRYEAEPTPEADLNFFDLAPGGTHGAEPTGNSILERNLRAIARHTPRTAELLSAATARIDVEFVETAEGVPSASIQEEVVSDGPVFTEDDPLGLNVAPESAKSRWLASRRRPLSEASRLADTIDLEANGAACVLGFGLGYHCQKLAERWGDRGVVVCFEPDLGLLRAVLERVDHSEWFNKGHVIIVSDPDDAPTLNRAFKGVEGVITLGATILEHPPSTKRLGESGQRFASRFADVLRAVRTNVVTTLVQSEVTLRNMLMNLDRYAIGRGVADLAGAAAGRPAVVVSAGPSLARNIDLLAEPGVREHFVIIATQTTLKPLLRAGVKPHFVTALDYHEISRRFYEGLTPEDVEGVTLIADNKANPAILEAFPGVVRCPTDARMQTLLGPALAASPGELPAGATVAHLAYFVARHLGCDPVILVGQDLGFTDGQYYAAGAAIHDVWSGELGPFRTLEQFEWERIARERNLLHRRVDTLGRPIYSDEQMTTYLQQFEVEFQSDAAAGKSVIDATEGGVAKTGTTPMPLSEAISRFQAEPVDFQVDPTPLVEPSDRLAKLTKHLRRVRTDANRVAKISRETKSLLERMLKDQTDRQKVSDLITKAYEKRDEVRTLEPAYGLVQFLNQTGTLNRYRADRAIELADAADNGGLDDADRQKRQIERDIRNVEWLAMAADLLEGMLDDTVGVLDGRRAKTTQDDASGSEERADPRAQSGDDRRVGIVLMGDLDVGGLGLPRDLSAPIATIDGRPHNALQLTLARVKQASKAKQIVVATQDADRARAIAGDQADGVRFETVDAARLADRNRAVAAARRWSPTSWRGGLGSLSCYDESVDLRELAQVLDRHRLTDAAIVGLDWPLTDPALIDQAIETSRGRQTGKRLAVCQAAPGLGSLIIDRPSIEALAVATDNAGPMASLGGVLGYIPVAPVADPIGKGFCLTIPPIARDLGRRVVADTDEGRELIKATIESLGPDWLNADIERVATAAEFSASEPTFPRHLTLELCTGRLASGIWGHWRRGADDVERRPIDLALALRTIEQLAGDRSDAVLTLDGVGDPLMHPACLEIIGAAKAAGVAGVHLRTDLLRDDIDIDAITQSGAEVISVDMLATEPATYASLVGHDLYERTKSRLEALLKARPTGPGGLRTPWIVPRITRCDEVYTELERFYDGWLMIAGAALIDPMPAVADEHRRIRALPLPTTAAARFSRDQMTVRCDGLIETTSGPIDLRTTPLSEAWRRVQRSLARTGSLVEAAPAHTELTT